MHSAKPVGHNHVIQLCQIQGMHRILCREPLADLLNGHIQHSATMFNRCVHFFFASILLPIYKKSEQ